MTGSMLLLGCLLLAAPETPERALEERPFPADRTVILRDERIAYIVSGTLTIPAGVEVSCQKDVHILGRGEEATIRVEGALKCHGVAGRDVIFEEMTDEWKAAYDAGVFTEFMEQRAPGHTVLDNKIYSKGLLDLKQDITASRERLDYLNDPQAYAKQEQLKAMSICAYALIHYAGRYAQLAQELAETGADPRRKGELRRIADVCRNVPANPPRDFWEALQYYWFTHVGVITELNTKQFQITNDIDRFVP